MTTTAPDDVTAVRAPGGPARRRISPWPGLLVLAPAALVAVPAARSGGFFPDVTGIAALAALAALLVRVVLAPDAFARPPGRGGRRRRWGRGCCPRPSRSARGSAAGG